MAEGGLEGESWAKPLAHLWQSRPPNMKKEREYNRRAGSKPPYCSVCSLFIAYQQVRRHFDLALSWTKSMSYFFFIVLFHLF